MTSNPNIIAPTPDNFNYPDNALFEWVEDLPRPRTSRTMQKEQLSMLHNAALGLPYRGVWNPATQSYVMDDPAFAGATYGEVMVWKLVHKAAVDGDMPAIKEVLDRVLGKPKQALETKSMTMSYSEFLEASAAEEAKTQMAENAAITITQTIAGPAVWERNEETLEDMLEGL